MLAETVADTDRQTLGILKYKILSLSLLGTYDVLIVLIPAKYLQNVLKYKYVSTANVLKYVLKYICS